MSERVVIVGVPRAGKSTLATSLARQLRAPLSRTDDLMRLGGWSEVSQHVSDVWLEDRGPWVIEGVAAVRALRKWLAAHPEGKPAERVIWMEAPREQLTPGQAAMAKGTATIWAEVEPELRRRGVAIEER